ncbi:GGDEF domain-containing phosphodiesterase [Campylobacter sp. 2018MI10]|uniref:EAL domain-containing protein n=2 Tax=unclassified Campylobacter TaxID=2593542 RepID=UPI001BDAC642|nr:GGDEF domain-containing phosphodiesterase [Campylobacter sp. 2018MI10]MBT0884578.1 EAL domain-containing protein [Campylobacter sp. 2018MI10]
MENKDFKKIKNILYLLIGVFVLLNFYLFMDSRNYVRLFTESYLHSLVNKEEFKSSKILSEFIVQDNKIISKNDNSPKLSELEIKELVKNNSFYEAIKVDKNQFDIRYYELINGIYYGFNNQFYLTNSRFYQFYIPVLLNICFFILIYNLYKQKNHISTQYQRSISTYTKRIEKLEIEASIDPLTQLKNKRSLEKSIVLMKNPKLLLVDIDEFKKINDYFDANTADDLLKHIALIMSDFADENHLEVYKLDGDLFALLEDNIEDEQRYEELVTELMQELKNKDLTIEYNHQIASIVLTLTMGLCLENENTLKKAFIALKRAKRDNKNFVCYSKFIDEEKEYFHQLSTAKSIQSAIAKDEILPFFQPIFDKDKNITKFESLVRIVKKTPEGTDVITPGAFLAVSIKMKQYEIIENFIIEKVVQTLVENQDIVLCVNLGGRDMIDSAKNNKFINLLRRTGVANRLIIEVLEDENISQNEKIKDFLKRIKELGCKIAIDDFGSGFSNFSYLLELMPDYIKIDGSIIEKITKDEKSEKIVKTIVLFSKSLGIKTVAEFVSTEEIFKKCIEVGVDEFQGFYLGKPSPTFTQEEIDLDFYHLKEKNA